jgi:hypothetical protein
MPFHRPLPPPREPPADLAPSPFNSFLALAKLLQQYPSIASPSVAISLANLPSVAEQLNFRITELAFGIVFTQTCVVRSPLS